MKERLFEKIGQGKYVDKETGEVLSPNQVISYLKKLRKGNNIETQLLDSELREVRKDAGIPEMKDTHQFNWNTRKGNPTLFTKNYKVFGREEKKNMTLTEKGLMFTLMDYIEKETNRIVIDGDTNPTNKTISELVGISQSTTSRTISNLKKKNILATKGSGKGREIYVNPKLMFDGLHICKETLKLFNIT